mmetsp:Transcript_56016/g.162310  ORF Transcript_56016/g.162310 Transcript_56016/m.162310 type:complete len:309 (+) Transcript_56016:232-1158(+)
MVSLRNSPTRVDTVDKQPANPVLMAASSNRLVACCSQWLNTADMALHAHATVLATNVNTGMPKHAFCAAGLYKDKYHRSRAPKGAMAKSKSPASYSRLLQRKTQTPINTRATTTMHNSQPQISLMSVGAAGSSFEDSSTLSPQSKPSSLEASASPPLSEPDAVASLSSMPEDASSSASRGSWLLRASLATFDVLPSHSAVRVRRRRVSVKRPHHSSKQTGSSPMPQPAMKKPRRYEQSDTHNMLSNDTSAWRGYPFMNVMASSPIHVAHVVREPHSPEARPTAKCSLMLFLCRAKIPIRMHPTMFCTK